MGLTKEEMAEALARLARRDQEEGPLSKQKLAWLACRDVYDRKKREETTRKREETIRKREETAKRLEAEAYRESQRGKAKEALVRIQLAGKPDRLDDIKLNDLWGWLQLALGENGPNISDTKRLKLRLLSEDVNGLIGKRAQAKNTEAVERAQIAATVKVKAKADHSLAVALAAAISKATRTCSGFLYLKVWVMPDDSRWYKVGITNDPTRRDNEQNVLPVAATTVKLVQLKSMDHARATETAIHAVLDPHRIRGANNKELFHLKDAELAALVAVLEGLEVE